jgi:hypothetical protein
MLGNYEWNTKNIWDTMIRSNLQIMGVKEGEETKGIDKLFNRINRRKLP